MKKFLSALTLISCVYGADSIQQEYKDGRTITTLSPRHDTILKVVSSVIDMPCTLCPDAQKRFEKDLKAGVYRTSLQIHYKTQEAADQSKKFFETFKSEQEGGSLLTIEQKEKMVEMSGSPTTHGIFCTLEAHDLIIEAFKKSGLSQKDIDLFFRKRAMTVMFEK